jgi:hypothetical protein
MARLREAGQSSGFRLHKRWVREFKREFVGVLGEPDHRQTGISRTEAIAMFSGAKAFCHRALRLATFDVRASSGAVRLIPPDSVSFPRLSITLHPFRFLLLWVAPYTLHHRRLDLLPNPTVVFIRLAHGKVRSTFLRLNTGARHGASISAWVLSRGDRCRSVERGSFCYSGR